jgi:hypothetical protein
MSLRAAKGRKGYRAKQLGKQVTARFPLAINETNTVGRADDRRNFIVAVYEKLGSARFSRHRETG